MRKTSMLATYTLQHSNVPNVKRIREKQIVRISKSCMSLNLDIPSDSEDQSEFSSNASKESLPSKDVLLITLDIASKYN